MEPEPSHHTQEHPGRHGQRERGGYDQTDQEWQPFGLNAREVQHDANPSRDEKQRQMGQDPVGESLEPRWNIPPQHEQEEQQHGSEDRTGKWDPGGSHENLANELADQQ